MRNKWVHIAAGQNRFFVSPTKAIWLKHNARSGPNERKTLLKNYGSDRAGDLTKKGNKWVSNLLAWNAETQTLEDFQYKVRLMLL